MARSAPCRTNSTWCSSPLVRSSHRSRCPCVRRLRQPDGANPSTGSAARSELFEGEDRAEQQRDATVGERAVDGRFRMLRRGTPSASPPPGSRARATRWPSPRCSCVRRRPVTSAGPVRACVPPASAWVHGRSPWPAASRSRPTPPRRRGNRCRPAPLRRSRTSPPSRSTGANRLPGPRRRRAPRWHVRRRRRRPASPAAVRRRRRGAATRRDRDR